MGKGASSAGAPQLRAPQGCRTPFAALVISRPGRLVDSRSHPSRVALAGNRCAVPRPGIAQARLQRPRRHNGIPRAPGQRCLSALAGRAGFQLAGRSIKVWQRVERRVWLAAPILACLKCVSAASRGLAPTNDSARPARRRRADISAVSTSRNKGAALSCGLLRRRRRPSSVAAVLFVHCCAVLLDNRRRPAAPLAATDRLQRETAQHDPVSPLKSTAYPHNSTSTGSRILC